VSTATSKRYYTPQEYLELEERSDTKHEYWNGEVFAMIGVTPEHDRIAEEIRRHLGNHLVGNRCEVFSSDVRVNVNQKNVYTYPDASVACDAEFDTIDGVKALTNPVIVVEVLSESTEVLDRGKKLGKYTLMPSLRQYVIVSQEEMRVDHIVRTDDGNWRLAIHTTADEVVHFKSTSFDLKLSAIYSRVEFPATNEEVNP
jgi:Uma2 family endonuclease